MNAAKLGIMTVKNKSSGQRNVDKCLVLSNVESTGKLLQSLLAFDIVSYNLGFVSTTTTRKLSLIGLASIQLFPTSDTVANYF